LKCNSFDQARWPKHYPYPLELPHPKKCAYNMSVKSYNVLERDLVLDLFLSQQLPTYTCTSTK
jgi:hypothetical protein